MQMKKGKIAGTFALLGILVTGGLSAEGQYKKFSDRLMVDLSGQALWPIQTIYSVGGSGGVGIAFRDFNLFFRGTAVIADLSAEQKTAFIPSVRVEGKIGILPNLLTLLPYFDAGVMNRKITQFDGTLSGSVSSMYAEFGIGAELPLTHEISVIPRVGGAYALLYSGADSSNQSGLMASFTIRYSFGRSSALDF